jgi:hypothetical protein
MGQGTSKGLVEGRSDTITSLQMWAKANGGGIMDEALAAAINDNRAIRFASRLYLVPTVGSGIAQVPFRLIPPPDPSLVAI